MIVYHLLLIVGLPIYLLHTTPAAALIVTTAVIMYTSGLCVTAGYHRLYSHSAYKINPVFEIFLLFLATLAAQGSAIRWSFEHRHHHAFVDTDKDPYSIKKGFWYAHCLWLFDKQKEIEPKVVADLMRHPILRFQHRYFAYLYFLSNGLVCALLGWIFSDYWGAVVIGWLARTFLLHHCTWLINSLAHTWGTKHFCQELSAVDNYIIALLTFGEGYHNYHHTFAYDYRNGIRWYHFDPTKWLIWTLSKLGLVSKLRRVHAFQVEKKLLLEHKRVLQEKIQASLISKGEWEEKISCLSESLLQKLEQINSLNLRYQEFKKKAESRELIYPLKSEIKRLKKSFADEIANWMDLSNNILSSTA